MKKRVRLPEEKSLPPNTHRGNTMKTFGVVARFKAPKGYRGVWINIYSYGGKKSGGTQAGGAYRRRRDADDIAKSWRHDCVYVHVKM